MKRQKPILVAALAAALLSGCGSEQPNDVAEPPIGEMLSIDDLREFALPLDTYLYEGPRARAIDSAERVLTVDCMTRFGFDYWLPELPADEGVGASRRYGVADADVARQYGYHPPSASADEQEFEAQSRSVDQSLTPEEETVLTGRGQSEVNGQAVPAGGCVGESRQKLAAGAGADGALQFPLLSDTLSQEAFVRAREDSRVRAAQATWSSCMHDAGYTYDDSWQATNDPAWSGDVASTAEITVAVLDVQCKKQANLVNIMATIEVAYQQRAIDANAEALAALGRDLDARAKYAADVLAAQP